jgi:hypothetical protein
MSEKLSATEFATAFSFEDWGFLCSKPDFLAAALASSGYQARPHAARGTNQAFCHHGHDRH